MDILKRSLICMAIIFCFLLPGQVFAHASLTTADPAPDSQLSDSPNNVTLVFNERLEKELFYIRVLDHRGKAVTIHDAYMSDNQKEVILQLPDLDDGYYTVTYKVISADGHSVSGSYVFSLGQATSSPTSSPDHSSHDEHGISGDMSALQLLIFITRIIYYMSVLFLVGWVFWGMIHRSTAKEINNTYTTWLLRLQRIFLLSMILMISLQIHEYVNGFEIQNLLSLFLGTSIGISWLISLGLALIGFLILHRSKWIDILWMMLIIAAQSINGHAMAFEPPIRTVLLDMIHILAAAIWAGGIFYIIIFRMRYKEHIREFLPRFSNAAFISIIVLTLTGIGSTLMFLPDIEYIGYTQWGIFLMVKTALVLLLIIIGSLLRFFIKKRGHRKVGQLLKVDFGIMLVIICIVGIFTYLNPLPANEPLNWHEMGTEIHMSALITPNIPGPNEFIVKVWVAENSTEPKDVQLWLHYKDNTEVAPIEVSLTALPDDEEANMFFGYDQYTYTNQGPHLAFSGKWEIEVRILDADDDWQRYFKEIMVY